MTGEATKPSEWLAERENKVPKPGRHLPAPEPETQEEDWLAERETKAPGSGKAPTRSRTLGPETGGYDAEGKDPETGV